MVVWPSGMPTRRVTAGKAFSIERGETLGVRLHVRSETGVLIWAATGDRFSTVPATADGGEGSPAELLLPCTDSDGWLNADGDAIDVSELGSYTHRYIAEVSALDVARRVIPDSTVRMTFVLPQGEGPVDLDRAMSAGTTAGEVVRVPPEWGLIVTGAQDAADRAEAAAEIAEAVAAQPDGIRDNAYRAEQAAANAESARAGAEAAATAATTAQGAAEEAQTAAAGSASTASTAATTAGEARDQAVAAQGVAEDAVGQLEDVDAAVTAAQAAQVGAETARPASQAARTEAQSAQTAAETARAAAEAAAATLVDGGWVDLSSYIISPFGGTLRGRKIGKQVELVANISGTIPSATGSTTVTAALPTTWRPTVLNRWGAVYGASGHPGVAGVRTAGTLLVANRSVTEWDGAQFSITYTV